MARTPISQSSDTVIGAEGSVFERQFELLKDELRRLTREQMQPALATSRAPVGGLHAGAEKRELLLGGRTIAARVAL
jgi:hypothetical protein